MGIKIAAVLIILAGAAAVIISAKKTGHPIKCMLITAFQSLASMLAVNVLSAVTGVAISVNIYTVAASLIFGMPSSIAFAVLNLIM
ncbi:MAG: pro-sigmaK processing inhibitor BofA family protein [Clostridia bacterium]|nr:pro-sigmaK processing inhibitor BofA family protein [Clostridia bacterium]